MYFSRSHEWIHVKENGANVGISDHAQKLLGEIVFVDLPEEGTEVAAGDSLGAVESVKSSVDFYAPCDGTVLAVNEKISYVFLCNSTYLWILSLCVCVCVCLLCVSLLLCHPAVFFFVVFVVFFVVVVSSSSSSSYRTLSLSVGVFSLVLSS
jgi:Glycine cleavage H-protein